MQKIADHIDEILTSHWSLHFAFQHKLLNLSAVAEFLRPYVTIRTKKEVSKSAILMNLSRLQRRQTKVAATKPAYAFQTVTVHSNLCSVTYVRSKHVHDELDKVYNEVQKQNGYMTLNQGMNEITLILKNSSLPILQKFVHDKPKNSNPRLAALGIQFSEDYVEFPGFIDFCVQKLTMQHINIWEISSTYTELVFYIDQRDIRLAFQTIQNTFEAPEEFGLA